MFPTTIVGSYPQPDWLIDRQKLAGRFPPRVRAKELWRVADPYLQQAQDDATVLAIRAQEDAGLDIVSDGEIRRESYSNRFATALEGVDLDNPGTALDRSGHPNPVPRIVGKIRRKHAVEVEDLKFLKRHTTRKVKITVPGPFTMLQQAQNDFYKSEEEAALDYAAAVNEEIRDLFAAGADVVQIDEPYMQARPEKARQYGLKALDRALDGIAGHDGGPHLLRLRGDHPRAAERLLVPAGARAMQLQAGLDRDRAVEPRLQGARAARRQAHHGRLPRPVGHERRDAGGDRRPDPPRPALHLARARDPRARLRHEVPAARSRRREAALDGEGGGDPAERVRVGSLLARSPGRARRPIPLVGARES